MAKEKKESICRQNPSTTGQIFGRKPSPFESSGMTLKSKSRSVPKDFLTADVLPEVTSTTWRCKRKVKKGKPQSLRPCHIELAFVGENISQKQGVPPGAYLRLCTEWAGDAYLIPVTDHQDAMTKSKAICECHKSKSRKRCAAAFSKKFLEKTAGKIQQETRAIAAKAKSKEKAAKARAQAKAKANREKAMATKSRARESGDDCLRWSKNGKRCLRRAGD